MAVTQLQSGYNPGAQLGSALGGGIQDILQGLMQGKAQQLGEQYQQAQKQQAQQKRAAALQQAGWSPESIAIASIIPEKDLAKFFGGFKPGMQDESEMDIQDKTGGMGAQGDIQAILQQLMGGQQQVPQTLQDLLGQPNNQQDMIMRALGGTQIQQPNQQQETLSQLQQLLGGQKEVPKEQQIQPQVKQKAPSKYGTFETPQERALKAKQEFTLKKEERAAAREEQKELRKEQRHVDAETLPVYSQINKAAKAARGSDMRLDRMENLIKAGDLTDNMFYRGLKALGKLPVVGGMFDALSDGLLTTDSQEFKKLSADFVKDAKDFFGSRITEKEVEFFMETIPTLLQTDAGKIRIIRNMRIMNEATKVRKRVMEEIIEENKGKRPGNLETLIEKRADKYLDALADEFKGSVYSFKAKKDIE
jgi:hypothetical protein